MVFDSAAHCPGIFDEVLVAGRFPHHRPQRSHVLLAQITVAGYRPRLEKGLKLPSFGPSLVVGDVGFESPHQGAVLSLRPQVGIKHPQGRLCGRRRDDVGRRACQFRSNFNGFLRLLEIAVRRGDVRVAISGRPRDIDDVDVGHVIHLACPGLPHGDYRQIHAFGSRSLRPSYRQRRF